jgi:antitoxin (DNA-binding transcriptional repressor) of toxin-antitoxin stability system
MDQSSERPTATHDGTPTISASSFKATSLELFDDIARTAGEMIVTKHGRPVVRVSAFHASTESPWAFMLGSIAQHGDIVSPDSELWAVSPTEPLAVRR